MKKVIRSKAFWDMIEVSKLRGMFLQGDKTISQIAQEMGRSSASTERKLSRLGLKRKENEGGNNRYTDDFKKAVSEFYYATNAAETAKKFGVSPKVIEGILFRMRRNNGPILIGKRKNEWQLDEVLIVLRYMGLKPLPFIAEKIGKTQSALESYLKRRGFRLHYINGLIGEDFKKNFRTTNTLPFVRNLEGDVFIPWVTIEDNLSKIEADQIQIYVVRAMAKFQRFLHGSKANTNVIEELWIKMEE